MTNDTLSSLSTIKKKMFEKLSKDSTFTNNDIDVFATKQNRYLATGYNFSALAFYFARGNNTVGKIVDDTTKKKWECLKELYMPVRTAEKWRTIADRFQDLWNLPNCTGAIDGKHIRIQKIPKSGLSNFNYKSYHSLEFIQ